MSQSSIPPIFVGSSWGVNTTWTAARSDRSYDDDCYSLVIIYIPCLIISMILLILFINIKDSNTVFIITAIFAISWFIYTITVFCIMRYYKYKKNYGYEYTTI
jgi:hypothetical protein